MSTLFSSDWEGTTTLDSVWDSEYNSSILSVASDQKFTGAKSLKCSGSNADYLIKSFTSSAICGVRFAFRFHTLTSANNILFLNSGISQIMQISINSATKTISGWDSGGTAYIGTGYVFSLDTWYQLELKSVYHGSLSWKLWDSTGKNLLKAEQSVSKPANPNITNIWFGPDTFNGTMWFDSFIADNAGYPGPLKGSFYPFPSFNPSY